MGEMVLVGTDDGLLVLDVDGRRAQAVTHAFMGRHITALAAASDSVLAAMMRYGVCRISAGERDAEWTLDAHVLSLASSQSAPHVCLAGAEPAALYRSDDGGRTWRELRALRCGPDAGRWYHPSPASSPHVLGLAIDPGNPDTLYAGIEVGGVYKSTDGGETFKASSQGLYEDIHKLAGHPGRPAQLWAATGNGVYRSDDGAESWTEASRGMARRYAAAIGVVTGRGTETVIASAAAAPPWNGAYGANAVIFRSTSSGGGWEPGMGGLPQTLDGVPVAFASSHVTPGRVYAGVASGELLASDNLGRSWYLLAGDQPSVQAVLCAPPRLQDRLDFGESGAATEPFGPNSAPGAHPWS